MDDDTFSTKYRPLTKEWKFITTALSIVATVLGVVYLFHFMPFNFVLIDVQYRYLLIALFLPLCFIGIRGSKSKSGKVPWYDILLSILGFVIPVYYTFNGYKIISEGWGFYAPTIAIIFGVILWIIVIEAARRSGGLPFTIIVIIFSLYPIIAPYMPGFLKGPEFSFTKVASYHAMSGISISGIPATVFGDLFFGYMLYALVLLGLGAGGFFTEFAQTIIRRAIAGVAKVAIVSSGLFGSISGAPVANVMVTGSVTIPAMKKDGLAPYYAGAVEACAATGGALMPPIMGVTAFIMAEFLQVPYYTVAVAAAVPSILYYLTLYIQIDLHARRTGMEPTVVTEVPSIWAVCYKYYHLILSLVFLVVVLFALRNESQAPWYATVVLFLLSLTRKETRPSIKQIFEMFEDAGIKLGELMGVMASVGMIIGAFTIGGLAYSFPYALVKLAGGNVWLILAFGAFTALILGMGVTVSAVYIFLALILAPALTTAGFDVMAVHLFILYWACVSYITPPVALAAFASASIAGANPMTTGYQAMRLGIAKYILPFIFVANPALILNGTVINIVETIVTTILALTFFSAFFEGYMYKIGNLSLAGRFILLVAGIFLGIPTVNTDIIGIAIALVVYGLYAMKISRNLIMRIMAREVNF